MCYELHLKIDNASPASECDYAINQEIIDSCGWPCLRYGGFVETRFSSLAVSTAVVLCRRHRTSSRGKQLSLTASTPSTPGGLFLLSHLYTFASFFARKCCSKVSCSNKKVYVGRFGKRCLIVTKECGREFNRRRRWSWAMCAELS